MIVVNVLKNKISGTWEVEVAGNPLMGNLPCDSKEMAERVAENIATRYKSSGKNVKVNVEPGI